MLSLLALSAYLATVGNGDGLRGLARLAAPSLNLLDDVHALDNGSEHNMTIIQPASLHGCDEELRTVGVWASIRHRHAAGPGVLQSEVLILELVAVDRLASGTVVVGEVAALAHEVGDNTVEGRAGNSIDFV